MAGLPKKAYNLSRGRVEGGTLEGGSDSDSDPVWDPNEDARQRMAERGVRIAAASRGPTAAASGDAGGAEAAPVGPGQSAQAEDGAAQSAQVEDGVAGSGAAHYVHEELVDDDGNLRANLVQAGPSRTAAPGASRKGKGRGKSTERPQISWREALANAGKSRGKGRGKAARGAQPKRGAPKTWKTDRKKLLQSRTR